MKFPERFRSKIPGHPQYDSRKGDDFGFFEIPGRNANGRPLTVIASSGNKETGIEWEHVSVSLQNTPRKCPSWEEMCIVKGLFWDATECVVQFHPPESDYVNTHTGCLHLWKQQHGESFPQPPRICV